MKINKNIANAYTYYESITNNTIYTAQDPHTFLHSLKLTLVILIERNFFEFNFLLSIFSVYS